MTEGDSSESNAVFSVKLSRAADATATVSYATADGTATAGTDYQTARGTLTFAAGTTSKRITVVVNGDTVDEDDETFTVTLHSPSQATLADATAIGNIIDDDAPAITPELSIADTTVTEGDSGGHDAVFTVRLSAAASKTVTVSYRTADDTATAGTDYQAASGALEFQLGQTLKRVTVVINGDTVDEADERFTVTLHNASNATLADASATGTIIDDDETSEPESQIRVAIVDFATNIKYTDFYDLDLELEAVQKYLNDIEFDGRTALLDASIRGSQMVLDLDDNDFKSVLGNRFVVIFTDGLENTLPQHRHEQKYDELDTLQSDDIDMEAYAIGVRGSDLTIDLEDEFRKSLCRLSTSISNCDSITLGQSDGEYFFQLDNIDQVGNQFETIARSLTQVHRSRDIVLRIPIGSFSFVRWTFDLGQEAKSPDSSEVYIDATYNTDPYTLDVTRHNGVKGFPNRKITGTMDDGDNTLVVFDLPGLKFDERIQLKKIRSWHRRSETSRWGSQSESDDSQTAIETVQHSSMAVVLVIDRSGSLKSASMKLLNAVADFLSILSERNVNINDQNRAPSVARSFSEIDLREGQSTTLDVSGYFADPDEDDLTYSVALRSPSGVVSVSILDEIIRIEALSEGSAIVRVTAVDPYGEFVYQDLTVYVESSDNTLLAWPITDSCLDGYSMQLRFFDVTNDLVWPGEDPYFILDGSYTYRLSCIPGAKVCFGARPNNSSATIYWGKGINGDRSCERCCYFCPSSGATTVRGNNLICS